MKLILMSWNLFSYTAREIDSYDLYYYRARYYDPTIQRFLSEDPIEFMSGDFNWYRYVGNDPVNFYDPFGFGACPATPPVEPASTGGAIKKPFSPPSAPANNPGYKPPASSSSPKAGWSIKGLLSGALLLFTPTDFGEGSYIETIPEAGADSDLLKPVPKGETCSLEDGDSASSTTPAPGGNILGKEEPECGTLKSYKDLHAEYNSVDKDGVKYERDHMPSGGALKEYALEAAKDLGLILNECMMNEILNDANAMMMPRETHVNGSDTHGSQNKDKMVNDAKDLNKAKNKDAQKMKEHLEKEREKNKSETDPDKKKKTDDCIDAMEKTLDSEEFANYDPKKLVDDNLGEYEDGTRTSKLKNGKTRKCWDKKIT